MRESTCGYVAVVVVVVVWSGGVRGEGGERSVEWNVECGAMRCGAVVRCGEVR